MLTQRALENEFFFLVSELSMNKSSNHLILLLVMQNLLLIFESLCTQCKILDKFGLLGTTYNIASIIDYLCLLLSSLLERCYISSILLVIFVR